MRRIFSSTSRYICETLSSGGRFHLLSWILIWSSIRFSSFLISSMSGLSHGLRIGMGYVSGGVKNPVPISTRFVLMARDARSAMGLCSKTMRSGLMNL